jgi:hypothetical protein
MSSKLLEGPYNILNSGMALKSSPLIFEFTFFSHSSNLLEDSYYVSHYICYEGMTSEITTVAFIFAFSVDIKS